MSFARLECAAATAGDAALSGHSHVLVILPAAAEIPADTPAAEVLRAALRRRRMKPADLAVTPLAANLDGGSLFAFVMVDAASSRFARLTALRRAAMLLLDESPREVAVRLFAAPGAGDNLAAEALYVLWINGLPLPSARRKAAAKPLQRIRLYGGYPARSFDAVAALARANHLARELTVLPPNRLTPGVYRKRLRELAGRQGWAHEEYDLRRLRRLGAGAFIAVAGGSGDEEAAIVRLTWQPAAPRGRVALVGKGICFDTGGYNLKPARYMAGMHKDMNGSAVALALLQAAAQAGLPVAIDAWLAIARNDLSPQAYRQSEIVTAMDGTTIEIVHTDAEGRMVLADTLALACGGAGTPAPDLIVDFATLTGSMKTALGNRYAGVFASRPALAEMAVAAGEASGERICVFPMDEDYAAALDSKVADIKQCTLEGEADHILAACFLRRFTNGADWIHLDLSAANCEGGLGAVAGSTTGFGVAWGASLLGHWLRRRP